MTTTPRRILVPTDLSPSSESALELAEQLAGRATAERLRAGMLVQ